MSSASRGSGTRRRMKLSSRDCSRPTTSEIRWFSSSVIRAADAARFNLVLATIQRRRYCRVELKRLERLVPFLGVVLSGGGHFNPVQLLFHQVERIVADFVAGAHRVDGLARCLERLAMNFDVQERPSVAVCSFLDG